MTTSTHGPSRVRGTAVLAATLATAFVLTSACSNGSSAEDDDDGQVTITVTGPNLWTNSGSSFGPAWEQLVEDFEAREPNITVKTNVLPLASFYQTESTQLSAGTASELVFNQAAYKSYMIHSMDDYLAEPNPYDDSSPTWLESFNQQYFGPELAINADGGHDFIPITFSGTALIYNKAIFEEAGVTAPISSFADLLTACGKFRDAGYDGLAIDSSDPWISWVSNVIFEMMLSGHFDELNVFDAAGEPGQSTQVTQKSWTKAVLTQQITTSTPEVVAALELIKDVYNECGTTNWSGVTGNSGAMSNPTDFIAGRAAMTIGTSFAGGLLGDVSFDYATMPFPTITTETTPLSQDTPARFGVSAYGAAFMIPSTTEGAKLDAAVKFLQFATAGENNEKLVTATTGIPSVTAAPIPDSSKGLVEGDWGTSMQISSPIPAPPAGVTMMGLYDGYMLGTKSIEEEQEYLQGMWESYYQTVVTTNEWESEPWVSGN